MLIKSRVIRKTEPVTRYSMNPRRIVSHPTVYHTHGLDWGRLSARAREITYQNVTVFPLSLTWMMGVH